MTALPGAEGSRVVLISVSKYREDVFPDVPGVANNVAELRRLFTDSDVWGLPEENVVCVDEQAGASEVLDRIHTAASEATEALVLYFAGHGLTDRDGLRLMLAGSSPGRPWTGLSYRDVRNLLLDHGSQAGWKTVILDCCFAGAAFDGTLSATDQITDLAAVRGTCLIAACGETEFAWAPPEEQYTAFSGELIRMLGQGVTGGPEFLDVEAIYHGTRTGLRAIGGPVPQRRVHEDGGRAVLGRNRAWRRSTSKPAPPTPAPVKTVTHRLRRDGVDVHIQVKDAGCHGITGSSAYFETERALIGIDLRAGAVAWAHHLGDERDAFQFFNCLQIADDTGVSVLDPATGHEVIHLTGDNVGLLWLPGSTTLVEVNETGPAFRVAGLSTRTASPIWEHAETFDELITFLTDGSGRPTVLAGADERGRLVLLGLRDGSLRDTGIELPEAYSAVITGDSLVWISAPDGSLTVKSIADGSTRFQTADLRIPGLDAPVSLHAAPPTQLFTQDRLVNEVVFVDARSHAAAIWYEGARIRSAVLDDPDQPIEGYGHLRTIIGTVDERPMTRVHAPDGSLLATHDRRFWKVDETTAISAPKFAQDDPATSRIALLDVPTGRVTELGTVTTLGNAVWSRTHLVAPTPDGVRIWRYRD